jgi:hypothetical protein
MGLSPVEAVVNDGLGDSIDIFLAPTGQACGVYFAP